MDFYNDYDFEDNFGYYNWRNDRRSRSVGGGGGGGGRVGKRKRSKKMTLKSIRNAGEYIGLEVDKV